MIFRVGEKGTGVSKAPNTTGVVSKTQKHSCNILDCIVWPNLHSIEILAK